MPRLPSGTRRTVTTAAMSASSVPAGPLPAARAVRANARGPRARTAAAAPPGGRADAAGSGRCGGRSRATAGGGAARRGAAGAGGAVPADWGAHDRGPGGSDAGARSRGGWPRPRPRAPGRRSPASLRAPGSCARPRLKLAHELAERLGQADVRADGAMEQLLRDGVRLGPALAGVGRLRVVWLGDDDPIRRGRRGARPPEAGLSRSSASNACATISGTASGSRPLSLRLYLTAIAASISWTMATKVGDDAVTARGDGGEGLAAPEVERAVQLAAARAARRGPACCTAGRAAPSRARGGWRGG